MNVKPKERTEILQSLAAGRALSKCTAGVPPARGRLAGREDEGGRDARGTLWATHLLTCTRRAHGLRMKLASQPHAV
ncbi:MAG: hypothetical protein ABSE73_13550 [Planctomycetota bacterium]